MNHTVSAADPRVLRDQVQAAAGPTGKSVSSTVAANMLAAGLMVFAMWGQAEHLLLGGWFVGMLGYQVLRARISQGYWRTAPTDPQDLKQWLQILNGLSVGSGVVWGISGWLLFAPDSVIHQAMLTVLLCAMAAGSIAANAMLRTGMQGSAAAILVLLMVRMALENERAHWAMVMMLAVYLLFILKWGKDLHAVVIESLQRRHQNHDLVEQLQHQTEAALEAQHEAERANQAKSKFLAAASHDLRQPLAALSLFAGVMSREKRPEQLHKLAGHVGTSVGALEMLFNGLLDVSKLDAGVTPVQAKDFKLQPLLDRLANDFAPEARHKQLQLDIPPSAARLHSDPRLLEQVLRNLVGNALRYTPQGRVSVTAEPRGNGWCIAVADTGIGIAPTHQERVFEEFFQVGNAERDRSKGLGLGLSIVRRLARLLDLHLELDSELGKGTTMRLQVANAHELAPPPAPVAQPPMPEQFPGLKVLLVDDEAPIRQAMGLLLQVWQCDVRAMESLDEVMQLAKTDTSLESTWEPDLVLSDYRLRDGVLGTEVLDWVRSWLQRDIQALLMTGDTGATALRHIETSGYPLLHKPVSPEQLQAAVREQLGMHPPTPSD